MTPTCREVIAILDDYIAGKLARESLERLEWHLSRCDSCVAYLASYRETIRAAQYASHADLQDLPPDLVVTILTTITTRK